jgi:hypothetical protein
LATRPVIYVKLLCKLLWTILKKHRKIRALLSNFAPISHHTRPHLREDKLRRVARNVDSCLRKACPHEGGGMTNIEK